MKKTPSTLHTAVAFFIGLTLLCSQQTAAASTFPHLGIVNGNHLTPRDTSFSIKLHSSQKLQKSQATLTLNTGMYKGLRYLKMYDLIGRKVVFMPLSYRSGISTYQIKLASLRPGIYVCSVYSDYGLVETRKIVHF